MNCASDGIAMSGLWRGRERFGLARKMGPGLAGAVGGGLRFRLLGLRAARNHSTIASQPIRVPREQTRSKGIFTARWRHSGRQECRAVPGSRIGSFVTLREEEKVVSD